MLTHRLTSRLTYRLTLVLTSMLTLMLTSRLTMQWLPLRRPALWLSSALGRLTSGLTLPLTLTLQWLPLGRPVVWLSPALGRVVDACDGRARVTLDGVRPASRAARRRSQHRSPGGAPLRWGDSVLILLFCLDILKNNRRWKLLNRKLSQSWLRCQHGCGQKFLSWSVVTIRFTIVLTRHPVNLVLKNV